jgi:hypothetical protein
MGRDDPSNKVVWFRVRGLGQTYPGVVPSYPSKLEERERTPGNVPVLAVPQPNTP